MVERIIGGINLVMSAGGMWFIVSFTRKLYGGRAPIHAWGQCAERVHWTLTLITVVLLVLLAVAGVRLIRRRPKAQRLCKLIFVLEIGYFVAVPMMPTKIASLIGSGLMGFGPQLFTLYPVVGLLALWLSSRRGNGGKNTIAPLVVNGPEKR